MKYCCFLAGLIVAVFCTFVSPSSAANTNQTVLLEVFVREGCPHCAAAKAYLPEFSEAHPAVTIKLHAVDKDREALATLQHYFQQAEMWPPGVPAFYHDGKLLTGFESPEVTGPQLHALVGGGDLTTPIVDTGIVAKLSVERLGLPFFSLAMGLLDGFNPCAMWVLLFLLSLLVHVKSRVRMALIASTFVLVSGVIYYMFMAAWLNIFMAIGLSSTVSTFLALLALVIGCINLKDFFYPQQGISLSIPSAAKPGLYARMRSVIQAKSLVLALLAVAMLAIVVNFVELLCTAGLPAMYTAILTQQSLNPTSYYAYLGLYILGYIADDSLMVGISVFALSSGKLTERKGRWLKLLSGLVMLVLALVMLLKPEWLF